MLHDLAGRHVPEIDTCRYDGSRLSFRGPRRSLEGNFVACLGGTETFGKFIPKPYPDLLEDLTGTTCVNFGWPNAGIDVFANDRALLDCVARARLCVLQVPCAVNMSNMYYRVHPRRNDRFLEATAALRALFDDVDFCEFSFTRHMLQTLRSMSQERFGYIRRELAAVWTNGMQELVHRIGVPVVLLWLSKRAPETDCDRPDIPADPALVSRRMLESLREVVHGIVEVRVRDAGRGADPGYFGPGRDRRAARALPGPEDHGRAARTLHPAIADMLEG